MIRARNIASAVAITMSLLLVSCAAKQQTGTLIGAGAGAATGVAVSKHDTAGALIGGAVGGLVGGLIGRQMDKNDEQKLSDTFESNATGKSTEWTNPDTGHTYSATPTETSQEENRPCRQFRLQTDPGDDAQASTVFGKACRKSDGTWEIVSG